MKYFILILFLAGAVQAQWTPYNKVEGRYNQHVKGDSSALNVIVMEPLSIKQPLSGGGYSISLTSSAQQLDDHTAQYVALFNYEESGYIEYAYNSSPTFWFRLYALTGRTIPLSNSNKIYVKGNGNLYYEILN